MKKYKRELDDKNIKFEQFNQNFETYKKKSSQIIEQKEK